MPDFTEITDHLTVMHHDFVEGTCAIAVGTERTMVVDAGAYPAHAEALVSHLDERGLHIDLLGLTHGHGDHVAGVVELDPVNEVIAHPGALTRALRATDAIADWAGRDAAVIAKAITHRLSFTRLVSSIDLGGVTVEVLVTPGHTSDSICFVVDDVLVGGDTVVTKIPPAFADGDSAQMIASLSTLTKRDWRGLVPGHGSVIDDGSAATAWLNNQRGYLEQLRTTVEELISTLPAPRLVDEVASRVRLDALPGTVEIERRLRNNARAMIAELLARP